MCDIWEDRFWRLNCLMMALKLVQYVGAGAVVDSDFATKKGMGDKKAGQRAHEGSNCKFAHQLIYGVREYMMWDFFCWYYWRRPDMYWDGPDPAKLSVTRALTCQHEWTAGNIHWVKLVYLMEWHGPRQRDQSTSITIGSDVKWRRKAPSSEVYRIFDSVGILHLDRYLSHFLRLTSW